MRVALGVEYDGSHYHGWQSQPGLLTVQDALVEAISKVADHSVQVYAAGRTDTGVHATGQVLHFDTWSERSTRAWIFGTNNYLPKDVAVRWAKVVDDDFHARFSATSRRYRYIIYNHATRPGLFRGQVTWHYRPLDHRLMREAASYLVGEHDFTSFRAMDCQSKTPIRQIHEFTVQRQEDLIILDVTANAFLHHMIRNIAGVLMSIGAYQKPVGWVSEVLAARDRALGGITAPPYGLYLVQVNYPERFKIMDSVLGPLFLTER